MRAMDDIPAGNFSEWLHAMRAALRGEQGMNVACGDCVGCCTSSYYIKVRPHETRALAAIAAQGADNLEQAPGPRGEWFMGFDEHGHCLMFDQGCRIYADRPDTCRTYDCRVFAASGMQAGEERPIINERISRWRFDYPTERARAEQRAVAAAASFLRRHPVRFPSGRIPSRPAEIAVLAVKTYEVFLDAAPDGDEAAQAVIAATRAFDQERAA
jgi:Fe-S-cluster containining protein